MSLPLGIGGGARMRQQRPQIECLGPEIQACEKFSILLPVRGGGGLEMGQKIKGSIE